jgi:peptidoglycan/LPS O-acetylase OafA/YrhL
MPSPAFKPSGDRGHFEVLDGLRGVAAGAVLLGHATSVVLGPSLIERKHLAVYFFFMLSGFVVSYAYEAKLKAGMSVQEFYLRRIIRLYPLIFASAVIAAASLTIGSAQFRSDPMTVPATLLAVLGLPSPHTMFSFGRFPVNPPQWSLFYEMIAYVVFGLFIAKAKNIELIILLLGSTVAFGITLWLYFGFIPLPWVVFHALAPFCVGVLLWRVKSAGVLPDIRSSFLVLSFCLIAVCCIPMRFGWVPDFIVVMGVFPLIIMCGTIKATGLTQKMSNFLGELSYPLYILHWTVLLVIKKLFLNAVGPVLTISISVVAAVAMSWALLVLYDRPVRARLSEKLLSRGKRLATRSADGSH